MRLACAAFLTAATLLSSGCGYIHFGRMPERASALGEAKAAEAYSSLSTEHKILKQELVLARRETDTLRIALERTGNASAAGNAAEIAARLRETAEELAKLRASYAKLQAERSAGRETTASQRELEEKLAAALRGQSELQAENTRLRTEIERAHGENTTLANRLTAATSSYQEAQAALTQLNGELLAQKEARAQAERSTAALHAQLTTVMAQATAGVSGLQLAKAPPAEASPTAELRVNTDKLRAPAPAEPAAAAKAPRKHTVRAGDTLEQISQRYYGVPDRWRTIYEANAALLVGGGSLRVGSELTIP